MQIRFGDYLLDVDRRELRRSGEPVALEPQVFDLLAYLIAHRDRVVGKDELLDVVWSGRNVSDSSLTSRVAAARRAIGDTGEAQALIRTIARRGVRFVGTVTNEQTRPVPQLAAGILAGSLSRSAAEPEEEARYAGLWVMLYASIQAQDGTLRIYGFVVDIRHDASGLTFRLGDGENGFWEGSGPAVVLAGKLYLVVERAPRHDAMAMAIFWGVLSGTPAILDGLIITRAGNLDGPPSCTRMIGFKIAGCVDGEEAASRHARTLARLEALMAENLHTVLPPELVACFTREVPAGPRPFVVAVPLAMSLAGGEREIMQTDPPESVRRRALLRVRELLKGDTDAPEGRG